MGQTPDQTRAEIVALREQMTEKVIQLRKAAERPVRVARTAALVTAGVVVLGVVAITIRSARHSAERRSLKGRLKAAENVARHPGKNAKKVVDDTREKIRGDLRKQLKEELGDQRPLHEKVLTGAVSAAASAAVPLIMKKLQARAGSGGAPKPR